MIQKRKYEIKVGDVFGQRTVIDATFVRSENSKHAGHILCKCSCGNEDLVPIRNLIKGESDCCKSCGQQKKRYKIDPRLYIGAVFSNRTITKIDPLQRDKGGSLWVTVICICGYESLVKAYGLLNGKHRICMDCYTKKNRTLLDHFKVGQRIGSRTVLDLQGLHEKGNNNKKVLCRCDCGYESLVSASWLKKKPNAECIYCFNAKLAIKNTKNHHAEQDIIFENKESLDSVFDSLLHNQIIEKQSEIHIQEQQRLQTLHNLDKDNIDDTFNAIIQNDDRNIISFHYKVGEKNGFRTIIEVGNHLIDGKDKNNYRRVKTICECGSITIIHFRDFKRGKYNSHGGCDINIYAKYNITIGSKFGKRTVIKLTNDKDIHNNILTLCQCECGKIDLVILDSLRQNKGNQCSACSKTVLRKPTRQIVGKRVLLEKLIIENKKKCKVLCECGRIDILDYYSFQKEKSNKSCIDCRATRYKKKVINGQKFSKWTVINPESSIKINNRGQGRTYCLCKCECGIEQEILIAALCRKDTESCRKCASIIRESNKRVS